MNKNQAGYKCSRELSEEHFHSLLKPCPFCGGTNLEVKVASTMGTSGLNNYDTAYTGCLDCNFDLWLGDDEREATRLDTWGFNYDIDKLLKQACDKWNKRY